MSKADDVIRLCHMLDAAKKIKEFVVGTRDRLIHGYFDIDLDIVWNIVSSDLPPLIAQLQKVVQENAE